MRASSRRSMRVDCAILARTVSSGLNHHPNTSCRGGGRPPHHSRAYTRLRDSAVAQTATKAMTCNAMSGFRSA